MKPNSQPLNEESANQLQVHIPADLNYEYRNITQVFGGAGEVVIEFGVRHHSLPNHVNVYDRLVMTPDNAFHLMKQVEQVLIGLRQHAQQQQQQKAPPGPGESVN